MDHWPTVPAPPPDAATLAVLHRFGLTGAALLGQGDEARAYALGEDRVLRIAKRPGAGPVSPQRLHGFLAAIAGQAPFRTPVILDAGSHDGTGFRIEKRIPGHSLSALLPALDQARRRTALRAYTEALDALRTLPLPAAPEAGEFLHHRPRATPTWKAYLAATAEAYLAASRGIIAEAAGCPPRLILDRLLAGLDALDGAPRTLVHGDYWPSNVMMDARLRVTGVIDFGATTLAGDPMLDAAGAVYWLHLVEGCTPADRLFVRRLLQDRFGPGLGPAISFYRAYFALRYLPDCANPAWRRWYAATLRRLAAGRVRRPSPGPPGAGSAGLRPASPAPS